MLLQKQKKRTRQRICKATFTNYRLILISNLLTLEMSIKGMATAISRAPGLYLITMARSLLINILGIANYKPAPKQWFKAQRFNIKEKP